MMYGAHIDRMSCWPSLSKKILNLLRQSKDRVLNKLLGALIPDDDRTSGTQMTSGKTFSVLFCVIKYNRAFRFCQLLQTRSRTNSRTVADIEAVSKWTLVFTINKCSSICSKSTFMIRYVGIAK
jgi:hypothetical protein